MNNFCTCIKEHNDCLCLFIIISFHSLYGTSSILREKKLLVCLRQSSIITNGHYLLLFIFGFSQSPIPRLSTQKYDLLRSKELTPTKVWIGLQPEHVLFPSFTCAFFRTVTLSQPTLLSSTAYLNIIALGWLINDIFIHS